MGFNQCANRLINNLSQENTIDGQHNRFEASVMIPIIQFSLPINQRFKAIIIVCAVGMELSVLISTLASVRPQLNETNGGE